MNHEWVCTPRQGRPIDFFPAGYDTSDLIEVSRVGDLYSRYIKRSTGEEVNCADFVAESQEHL